MTPDPLDEIRQASLPARFDLIADRLAQAEQMVADIRKLRDDSIKEYRATTKLGATKIAEAAKVSLSTVKAVLR
jgi:hypothetical protein